MTLIEQLEKKLMSGESLTPEQLRILSAHVSEQTAAEAQAASGQRDIEKRRQEIEERSRQPHLSSSQRISLGYEMNELAASKGGS